MAYNDQVAYPWFAPAGLTRGVVTNATNVGYINGEGEFVPVALTNGQRDTLYGDGSRVGINPIARFPGQGVFVFGQRTLQSFASALDRVNVARLIAYLRERFDPLARPFIFEPNDQITRSNAKQVFVGFLNDLMSKRALYDFIVVCDESNNTPARIDRNELWIDIAIEPVKAAEFIYIPIRVVNTGELSAK
jgi:phage tail sheath protein FI